MPDHSRFTRRERQIMEIVFARNHATVNQIRDALPDPPTAMAIRRMMHILEEKGYLGRREHGREVVYFPREPKQRAGCNALQRVLETFFGGSLKEAVSAHLLSRKNKVTPAERHRLLRLIEQARKEGR